MNKARIVSKVIELLIQDEKNASKSSQVAREASIDAPGAMQSQHDTTKTEQDWLSRSLASMSEKIKREIRQLKNVNLSASSKIQAGSLVTLMDIDNEVSRIYLILPGGSGKIVELRENQTLKKIIIATPQSPIGKAMIGREEGDTVEINTPGGTRRVTVGLVE